MEVLRAIDGTILVAPRFPRPTPDQAALMDVAIQRAEFRRRQFRARFAFRVRAIQALIGLGLE